MNIWGVRAGLIGDLVMALPILTYLEKKYPGSYKYWAVHQKCAQAAPLFMNHPLIDRIKVTDGWVNLGPHDRELMDLCELAFDVSPPVRDHNWRNEMTCIDQTARMAGIDDLDDVLKPHEKIPHLDRWFPSFSFSQNPNNHGYVDHVGDTYRVAGDRIAIWPFANYGKKPHRSPSEGWWTVMAEKLIDAGYEVYHYGWLKEPQLLSYNNPFYHYMCKHSFFDQIRSSLEAKVSIGTDSGSMWVLGAYGQPGIELMTYHEHGHTTNPWALMPPYENHTMLFNEKNINLIKHAEVIKAIGASKWINV